jgi:heme/copper-type cytochrome/quinol oxidase subunit 4
LGFVFIIIILALVSFGTKIYYLVHVNSQTVNDTNKRVLWTLILIFTGFIGSIVYYFIEIVPLKKLNN